LKYRVLQWATGSVGKTCVRAVIDRPDLELVGLHVYSEKKAATDAGVIAGQEPAGVVATREMAEVLALHTDVVNYATR